MMGKEQELEISLEEFPWTAEDWAYSSIGINFGINEAKVDQMPPEERRYWAAFTTTVASMIIVVPPNSGACHEEPRIMSREAQEALDKFAKATRSPTHFLHELCLIVKQKRSQKVFPYYGDTTPDFIYGNAVADLLETQPQFLN